MDPKVIAGLIALIGVLTSITITMYLNILKTKIEDQRFYQNVERDYLKIILEKRIMAYQNLYQIISDFIKKIKIDKKISATELNSFFTKTNSENSKTGLYFSLETGEHYFEFWNYMYKLNEENKEIIESSELYKLRQKLQEVEIQLKKDIGIYIVDLKDGKRNLNLPNNYAQILKESKMKIK